MAAPARPPKLPGRPVVAPAPSRSPPSAPAAGRRAEAEPPVVLELPGVDAKLFEPDGATIKKLTDKDPKSLAKVQAKSREQVIQTVHALRLLSPGVLGVMASEVSAASEPEQAERFASWMAKVREAAREWASAWSVSPDDLPWVTAALERFLAEHPQALEQPALLRVTDWVQAHASPPPAGYLPVSISAPLALLQALGPVQRVQSAYPLGRRHAEADLEAVAGLLVEAATDAVNELVEPAAPGDVRALVFSSVLADSGKTLAQLWVAFAQSNAAKWRLKTKQEQEFWHQANPNGVDLQPLFEQFQDFSARLRRLTRAARLRK